MTDRFRSNARELMLPRDIRVETYLQRSLLLRSNHSRRDCAIQSVETLKSSPALGLPKPLARIPVTMPSYSITHETCPTSPVCGQPHGCRVFRGRTNTR
jgi:hypothetical protein